jgi:hypothetical protein
VEAPTNHSRCPVHRISSWRAVFLTPLPRLLLLLS